MRRAVASILLVALVAAGAALLLRGRAAAAPSTGAVLFVAPGGSDEAACTLSDPCRSFARAYVVARPGTRVEVAAGTYGPQTIPFDAGKRSGEDVVFAPGADAAVTVAGEVVVHGRHVELRGLRLAGGWQAKPCADDVTVRDAVSKHFFIASASNVRILGGSVGPGRNYDSQIAAVDTGPCAGRAPSGIVIDGVDFHDWTRDDPEAHVECLQIAAADGVVVRNSTFRNCATHDIFVRGWGIALLRNLTIEDNFLAASPEGHYSIRVAAESATVCERVRIRRNVALDDMLVDCAARDVRVVGNAQPTMSATLCGANPGVVWDGNVYASGTTCGPRDVVRPARYRAAVRRGRA